MSQEAEHRIEQSFAAADHFDQVAKMLGGKVTLTSWGWSRMRCRRPASLLRFSARAHGDALVFPALDGGPASPRNLSGDWSEIAEDLGMPDVTFHALRYTHASQLIDAGVHIVTISKRLGHASPAITLRIYAHLFRQRDDKASAAINAALAGLGPS